MDLNKTKNDIIKYSEELFSSMGVKVVTMDDIAEAMSISKKTIYSIFSNKEDIIDIVFRKMLDNMEEEVKSITAKNHVPIIESRELQEVYSYYLTEMNSSNLLQTKKYYTHIYDKIEEQVWSIIKRGLSGNIKRGIDENIFRINTLDNDNYLIIYYQSLKSILTDIKLGRKKIKELLHVFLFHYLRGIASYKGLSMLDAEERRLKMF